MRRPLPPIAITSLAVALLGASASAQPAPPDASAPGVTEKPAEPPKAALGVTYDRGVTIATADRAFRLRLGFRNQIRFESARSTDDGSQFASRFLIPRSRLQADGNAFGTSNRYKLEFAFGDQGSFAFVKDLYLDKQVCRAPVWIRAGQWKRPFNRQELVSDFGSEFNERANTAAFVGGGRDLGLAIHNDYERSPEGLEWVLGVFNGFNGGADRPNVTTACTQDPITGVITCITPPPTTVPADFGPAVVARVGWNVGNIKGYTEGDFEGGPARLAVGLSYKIDLANFDQGDESSVSDNLSHGLQVDAMVKVQGFGLELGGYMMKQTSASAEYGILVQPGYFVVPKHVQLAGRFAYAPVGARKQVEARAAFNWYWEGHAWKWATDFGMLKLTGEDPRTMASDKPDFQLRSMLQLTL